VHPGHKMLMDYFSCSDGPSAVSIKSTQGHVTPNFCFASIGICGSRSAFLCNRGVKHRCTIFILGWARIGFHKKCAGTRYIDLLFLHPMGSAGHVVHSVHSGCETVTHYFSCSDGTGTYLTKNELRHVTPNLCFYIRWDLRVM
jgi:hypothetical protein